MDFPVEHQLFLCTNDDKRFSSYIAINSFLVFRKQLNRKETHQCELNIPLFFKENPSEKSLDLHCNNARCVLFITGKIGHLLFFPNLSS